jgi:hypothetical protein
VPLWAVSRSARPSRWQGHLEDEQHARLDARSVTGAVIAHRSSGHRRPDPRQRGSHAVACQHAFCQHSPRPGVSGHGGTKRRDCYHQRSWAPGVCADHRRRGKRGSSGAGLLTGLVRQWRAQKRDRFCPACPHQTGPRQTLLVNSRQSISNAIGVSVTRGMYSVSLAFKGRMQNRFSARFCINQQSHDILDARAE